MPRIAEFQGILIRIHHGDHPPPHLHAKYQDQEAMIDLNTFRVIEGDLPPAVRRAVGFWAKRHRDALLENWERGQNFEPMETIEETVDD